MMIRFLQLILIESIVCLILFQNVAADQLILKSGRIYIGQLLFLSKENSTFQVSRKKIHFSYNNIAQLTTTSEVFLKTQTGNIFRGQLIADGDSIFSLSIPGKGIQMFSIYDFESISFKTHPKNNQEQVKAIPTIAPLPTFGDELDPSFNNAFLRDSAILLKPGDIRFRMSSKYSHFNLPALGKAITYSRTLTFSTSLDIGFFGGSELFCTYPLNWKIYQEKSGQKIHKFLSGVTIAGFKYMLLPEHAHSPEIISRVVVKVPTGKLKDEIKLSTTVSGEITAFKSIDPVVISAKLGGTLYATESSEWVPYSNDKTKQMDQDQLTKKTKLLLSYGFDFGFAINKKISLCIGFSGYYKEYLCSYKEQGFSSSQSVENTFFNTSLYYRLAKNQTINPSLNFGLFNETSFISMGISYSYKF